MGVPWRLDQEQLDVDPSLLSLTPLCTRHCQQHEPFIGCLLIPNSEQRATLKIDRCSHGIELKLR
jgi:hypothetical protein